jgi:phosphatidylethanolamine-binding protein (PEBP) family uncharacterized protein
MRRAYCELKSRRCLAGFVIGVLLATTTACSTDGREMRLPRPDQNESIITTTSQAEDAVSFDVSSLPALETDLLEISIPWTNDEEIPAQFTCRGEGKSPNVSWFDVSPDAVAMAIILYEENTERIAHWVVANLDPQTAYIEVDAIPLDAIVGSNDPVLGGPDAGYSAPCPAAGQTSSYTLEVHALSQFLEFPTASPSQELIKAIDLTSIQMTAVTGTFTG